MWKGLSSKKPKSLECDKGQEKADLVSFLPDRHFLLLCAIPTSAAKTRDSPRPQQARGPLPQHSVAMTAALCCLPLPRAGRSPFAFPPSEQGGLRGARAEWTLGQPQKATFDPRAGVPSQTGGQAAQCRFPTCSDSGLPGRALHLAHVLPGVKCGLLDGLQCLPSHTTSAFMCPLTRPLDWARTPEPPSYSTSSSAQGLPIAGRPCARFPTCSWMFEFV